MKGRITSVLISLTSAAQPLGMILSGVIAKVTGTANLFLGSAALGILTIIMGFYRLQIRGKMGG